MEGYKLYMYKYLDEFKTEREQLPIEIIQDKNFIVLSLISKGLLEAQDIALVDVVESKQGFKVLNRNNQVLFSIEK